MLRLGLIAALTLIAAAACAFFRPDWRGFPLDDAYIHLVYARNLAAGHGFAFNVGEPSIGTTSPLWTFLLALAALLRLGDLRVAANLISLLCFIASVPLIYLLTERIIRGLRLPAPASHAAALGAAAALLVVANGNFLWFALDGMETTLFVFIGLAACWTYQRRGLSPATGALLGLLILTRPEGALLYALIVLVHLLRARRAALRDWIGLLLPIVIYLPWLLYSASVTGSLLPTTFKGKTAAFVHTGWDAPDIWRYLRDLLDYLRRFAPITWLATLLSPVALIYSAARWRSSRARALLWLLAAWWLAHLAIYTVIFRFPYHHFRYLALLFAVAAILGAVGAAVILAPVLGRLRAEWARHAVLAAIPLAILIAAQPNLRFWRAIYHHNVSHVRYLHELAGGWLRDNTAPDDTIAAFDIGVVKYHSGRRVVDLGALVDPEAARYLADRRMGPYLIRQRVDVELDLGNRLTGTDKDDGLLYHRLPVRAFSVAPYDDPLPPHSRYIFIYRIVPIAPPR